MLFALVFVSERLSAGGQQGEEKPCAWLGLVPARAEYSIQDYDSETLTEEHKQACEYVKAGVGGVEGLWEKRSATSRLEYY